MILAERTVASRFLWRISIHCMDCIEVVNEKLFHTHGLFITFNWKSFSQQKILNMIKWYQGVMSTQQKLLAFLMQQISSGFSWKPVVTEAKRFPSNFPGGAKRTSVDTRGVSAGTGSVCKLFVRKAQREKVVKSEESRWGHLNIFDAF